MPLYFIKATQLNSERVHKIIIEEAQSGFRLDQVLTKIFPTMSRTSIQALIDDKHIDVNGQVQKKRYLVSVGDCITVFIPQVEPLSIQPEPMVFSVLYEDDSLFVIDKPPGLVVHPAPGNRTKTFVHGLLAHCQHVAQLDPVRPGIVHRLDKETSGVLAAAKTKEALFSLSRQFQERGVSKEYFAIVQGELSNSLEIQEPIGRDPFFRKKMGIVSSGKSAYTKIFPLAHREGFTLVKAVPLTGRTHQIRVHLSHLGFPIVGDSLYGWKKNKLKVDRHMLHCHRLRFLHPTTALFLDIAAALPPDMCQLISFVGFPHESYCSASSSGFSIGR